MVEIFVHKMTEHMETAVVLAWLINEGDYVERGMPILEVETEKATVEIESPASGYLKGKRTGAEAGIEVKVGETLAFIAEEDELVPALPPLALVSGEELDHSKNKKQSKDTAEAKIKNVLATPVARRIAKEKDIDLSNIIGSGPGGRIREEDVHHYIEKSIDKPNKEISSKSINEMEKQKVGLNRIQKATAKRMIESAREIPQFTLNSDVDVTSVLKIRDEIKEEKFFLVSINAIFIKVVANTLTIHPRLNAKLIEGFIHFNDSIHIGIAVGSEEGLVVPVIKNAQDKDVLKIDEEIQKYKDKLFSADDLNGATFTVSNLGMYGIKFFNAIINPPQAAILAIGQIEKQLSVLPDGDLVAIRPRVVLSLTADHRFLDGYHAAHFLSDLKKNLENIKIGMVD